MRLAEPFLRLPLKFDAGRIAAEIAALPGEAWVPHPGNLPGNDAVRLITTRGEQTDDTALPMAPTDYLRACPAIQQVMGTIGAVWGRSRLMRLAPSAPVPAHVDAHYYWRTHVRLHVPIITSPDVLFTCDDQTVHMGAGECWMFDTFRNHSVQNGAKTRIHLVIDTAGGERLWTLMEMARASAELPIVAPPPLPLMFEKFGLSNVMSPWELRYHVDFIAQQARPHPALESVLRRVQLFIEGWNTVWLQFGPEAEGWPNYADLIARLERDLPALGGQGVTLRNGLTLDRQLAELIYTLNQPLIAPPPVARPAPSAEHSIERPIFVVSPPRSGSTLLFQSLTRAKGVFTIGGESHHLIEDVAGLHPAQRQWRSNQLTAADATPATAAELKRQFLAQLHDRDGARPRGPVRMMEKTPKNSLRIDFFDHIFPDASFVFLYRDPKETLSSMMEAWQSGLFRTYPRLPWGGLPWSLLLVPGWQKLAGKPLPEIVAQQWATTMTMLIDQLEAIDDSRIHGIAYDDLLADPDGTMAGLCDRLGLEWDRPIGPDLPLSPTTVSAPNREKWRRHEAEIASVWPIIEPVDARAREALKRYS